MIEKGIYLHYKGGVYEVVGNAEHTETNEELVLYRDIKNPNGKIWARPAKMWDDIVDGKKRFQKLDIEHVPENYDGVLISRQAAIDIVLEYARRLYKHVGTPEDNESYSFGRGLLLSIERNLKELPFAEPKRETTTLRIGRTRNSVTMWYECAECGEPVDQEDAFCRRCGRGIIHE